MFSVAGLAPESMSTPYLSKLMVRVKSASLSPLAGRGSG
jgi:hypothetical protein